MDILESLNYNNRPLTILGSLDKPWFVAKEVGQLLDIKKVKNYVSQLDDDEKSFASIETNRGLQEVRVISEGGLYFIAARSNKPEAKAFDKHVRNVILPEIRKNGYYQLNQRILQQEQLLIASEANLEASRIQIETLENRLATSRQIRRLTSNDMTISERIVFLNILPQDAVSRLNKGIRVKGGVFKPDSCKLWSGHLISLGKKLSALYQTVTKDQHNKQPSWETRTRNNVFDIAFYEQHADKAIRTYFGEDKQDFLDAVIDI